MSSSLVEVHRHFIVEWYVKQVTGLLVAHFLLGLLFGAEARSNMVFTNIYQTTYH
jgi:hypothetical protein